MPSLLFVGEDGLLAGEVAEDRGAADPSRLISDVKRRLGDDVPVTVGDTAFTPEALTAALLRHVAGRAGGSQGGAPTELLLTHPGTWGAYKLEAFDRAVEQAGVGTARRCTEAQAAAAAYAARHQLDPGMKIVVYDLGGGTFDVTVLERTPTGFAVLGTPGEAEGLGGTTFDEAVYRLVLGAVGDRVRDLDQDDPDIVARLAQIRRSCVSAKETLSTETQAAVPVDLPGFTTTVRVTRSEFVSLIRSSLRETTAAVRRVLSGANTEADELTAIALVGGSSRIPAVSEVLQREFGVPLALSDHPKHDVAVGALLALQPAAAIRTACARSGARPRARSPPRSVRPRPDRPPPHRVRRPHRRAATVRPPRSGPRRPDRHRRRPPRPGPARRPAAAPRRVAAVPPPS